MLNRQHDFSQLTDEEIITLYKGGDEFVFKDLINKYTSSLYNFTARLTNKRDASDIVQEIFIKIWKNLKNFDSKKASFKTWIFTIARNAITDFFRKKHNLSFSDIEKEIEDEDLNSFAENIPDEQILPDTALEKLQDKEFLNNILKTLSMEENEILILHYQEEMTFAEMGKVLKKNLNTVKSKHRRILIKLRKAIG